MLLIACAIFTFLIVRAKTLILKLIYDLITLKDPKEIADRYIERYADTVALTNRIVVIGLLVLLTNWLFIMENNYAKYMVIKANYSVKITKNIKQINALKKTSNAQFRKSESYIKDLDSLKANSDTLKNQKDLSIKQILEEVKDLPSLIKFVFFISDNLKNGGAILNLIFFSLVLFVLLMRRRALKFLSRALRIYKIEPDLKINKYHDFNIPAPVWLAPLPQPNLKTLPADQHILTEEISVILGWSRDRLMFRLLVAFTLIAILLIQCRLSFITYNTNPLHASIAFSLSVIFFFSTLMLVWYWLEPLFIADHFNNEINPNAFGRRDLIKVSTFSILAFALYRFLPVLEKHTVQKRKPRFIAKRIKYKRIIGNLNAALVQNIKSHKVHYINAKGFLGKVSFCTTKDNFKVFASRLRIFSNSGSFTLGGGKTKLSLARDIGVETFVLENLSISRIDETLSVLLFALDNSSVEVPNYRLWDLAAVVGVRYRKIIGPGILQKIIEKANVSNDRILLERAKKWLNQKWQATIAKKNTFRFNKMKLN